MLIDQIKNDLDQSLRKGDKERVSVLRMVLSSLQEKARRKKYELSLTENVILTDEETIEVLLSEAKKRKESIKEFQIGKRDDLVQKESEELDIIYQYLPNPLSYEELTNVIKEVISVTESKSQKDIGKLMPEIIKRTKGRADGSEIIKIIKELLS